MSRERRFSEKGSSFAIILLLGLLLAACDILEDVRPRTMFGEGLSHKDEKIHVHLNVGLLTAESEKLYPREKVSSWLEEVSVSLEKKYEGVEFHFILDQPQDLEFITARAIARDRLPLKSPFATGASEEQREAYLRGISFAPLLNYANHAQASLHSGVLPVWAEPPQRNSLSVAHLQSLWSLKSLRELQSYNYLSFWQSYAYSQIHYDVILVDVSVFPDDPYRLLRSEGPRSHYLIPAPGRAALDRVAVLISISDGADDPVEPGDPEDPSSLSGPKKHIGRDDSKEGGDSDTSNRHEEVRSERIVAGMESLLLSTGSTMDHRREIFRSLASFHRKGKKIGCAQWNESSHLYIERDEIDPLLLKLLLENRRNLNRLCRAN